MPAQAPYTTPGCTHPVGEQVVQAQCVHCGAQLASRPAFALSPSALDEVLGRTMGKSRKVFTGTLDTRGMEGQRVKLSLLVNGKQVASMMERPESSFLYEASLYRWVIYVESVVADEPTGEG